MEAHKVMKMDKRPKVEDVEFVPDEDPRVKECLAIIKKALAPPVSNTMAPEDCSVIDEAKEDATNTEAHTVMKKAKRPKVEDADLAPDEDPRVIECLDIIKKALAPPVSTAMTPEDYRVINEAKENAKKDFKCLACNKIVTPNRLTIHRGFCRCGRKFFKCPSCKKRFSQRHCLNLHVRSFCRGAPIRPQHYLLTSALKK